MLRFLSFTHLFRCFLYFSHLSLFGFLLNLFFNAFLRYISLLKCLLMKGVLGGDYMIPVCWDEISPRPAGTDLTLRLHVEIKFRPGKAGQFPPGICLDLYAISLNFSL